MRVVIDNSRIRGKVTNSGRLARSRESYVMCIIIIMMMMMIIIIIIIIVIIIIIIIIIICNKT